MPQQAPRMNEPTAQSPLLPSTSSYVYPVRSLLSGIRPAREDTDSQDVTTPAAPLEKHGNAPIGSSSGEAPPFSRSRSGTGPPAPSSTSLGSEGADSHTRRKLSTPNFRDFAPNEDPLCRRSFASARHQPMADSAFNEDPASDAEAAVQVAAHHPPQFSDFASEAFHEVAPDFLPLPDDNHSNYDAVLHGRFSQSGIVHLPPLDSTSGSNPSAPSTISPSSSRGCASRDSAVGSDRSAIQTSLGEAEVVKMPSAQEPDAAPSEMKASDSSSSGDSGEGPRIAFRYTHAEDEDGHHLIVGREGELVKCEDEPIRTPGAVQGYGILIAVEEDEETGDLVVRQASENSAELLGLSPKYLFSLECFSQTLPDQQADVLFDNIQYLNDTSLTPEEQAENLHVFMLSGWGEPDTVPAGVATNDPQRRRSWSCWCAAHRPQMTAPANMETKSNDTSLKADRVIIILEFELERDTFNPLYPAVSADDTSSMYSGVSSPSEGTAASSNSASNSATDSSGRTLVSSSSSQDRLARTPEESSSGLASVPSSGSDAVLRQAESSPARSGAGGVSAFDTNAEDDWMPSPEDILESTTSRAKPLPALERLRRTRRVVGDSSFAAGSNTAFGSSSNGSPSGHAQPESLRRGLSRRRRGTGAVGMMDVFAVMAQINEQLGAAPDLETFLKVVVGVIKDLTQFHRVVAYQFDELWNGQVVAELVDWKQTHELFRGLHFPATDIPAQARHLYVLNKVRLLYDRAAPTARLVVRSKRDLETPLDMTHCYLRAMSPIHLKYLENMQVRASMSVSIVAFGQLWGLVACHSYGSHGMRVSFPVRQMLRLLSQSVSRNVERLSYAQRLSSRKLINTMPSDQHPSGYIVSNADDLLGLFDADHGVLVIGEGAKILGPNQHGQEILIVAEYLRLKQFDTIQVSQAVTQDYPDLHLNTGLEVIAGLLYVPLSAGGRDFIAFLRKGQPREVRWAGRPYKDGQTPNVLEPRASFRLWSETVAGRCRAWSDEHLETAGVLALVYGKFIEVWRQKESALQTTKLTNLLLSNASHEVRTPLNHIINYLEMALNGSLDSETRENLSQSHAASKSLLLTINDLLVRIADFHRHGTLDEIFVKSQDLTRLESGNETSFNEVFDLHRAIEDAIIIYKNEAARRGLIFSVDLSNSPTLVVGDYRKIRTVVANLTANALKYTERGGISLECHAFEEPAGLRDSHNVAVEIIVSDTGHGISAEKLECIFREFEQVESTPTRAPVPGLGLGLAVVARIVEQLGGQLRVDSRIGEGSRFSFLIPFTTDAGEYSVTSDSRCPSSRSFGSADDESRGNEIDNLVQAFSSHLLSDRQASVSGSGTPADSEISRLDEGRFNTISTEPEPSSKLLTPEGDSNNLARRRSSRAHMSSKVPSRPRSGPRSSTSRSNRSDGDFGTKLRLLIVEDNDINRMILAKRLSLDGHNVVNTTNGQEGLDMLQSDFEFDAVLMDIQMPLLNGFEATERIRGLEHSRVNSLHRTSHKINGRIPIFAVSASLFEDQQEELFNLGFDGWILKPIDFKRLRVILRGVVDTVQRAKDVYQPNCNWEVGGWLRKLDKVREDDL
ncbi:uncharacterized protein B0H18DRAFT_1017063 [Fomitopsis serialis]|uniref:uncharacterized protein n=1 Tax=Fomitopsis serialis TaxID=139415 RepID=UPI002007F3B2|nr:uncharacterized protein B0H18DRAFT_1017063 [Neoantrodia serialis]KAH9922613.1 hypothetical protein B0H18DRAFT_1017063 [Neoantrodia serialis]